MRREDENFSMYSDHVDPDEARSRRRRGMRRAPGRAPSSRRPVGPMKMNDPIGRFRFLTRRASAGWPGRSALIASSWPTMTLVQFILHSEQPFRLLLLERVRGDARPSWHHEEDILLESSGSTCAWFSRQCRWSSSGLLDSPRSVLRSAAALSRSPGR